LYWQKKQNKNNNPTTYLHGYFNLGSAENLVLASALDHGLHSPHSAGNTLGCFTPHKGFYNLLKERLPSIRTFFTQTKGYMLTIGQSVMQAKGSTE
jgi:hypothetical protein